MRIAIVDRTTRVSNRELRVMIAACRQQLERHVMPAWGGQRCPVTLYPSAKHVPRCSVGIMIRDDYDQAADREDGLLGYHAENKRGVRWGRVFVAPVLDSGGTVLGQGNSVSVTLSHEIIEAYVDPDVNLWAEGAHRTYWSYEACDPVEETSYTLRVDGHAVGVSNFVYPAWFDVEHLPHEHFDYLRLLRKPFEVLAGGYAVYRQGHRELTRWGKPYSATKKQAKLRAKLVPLARSARRLRGA